ncbi:MAG TPA: methyl-accepting chemotaxis protein [Candidatus Ozemobacteraceae bacterium]|nr:methyl-accepting chemotaxis protein [Candidatus Ozemobacteraceae bacterium]
MATLRRKQRRHRVFIKPGFQFRLTLILILVVIIVANIVGALVYGLSIDKLESKLVVEAKLPIDPTQLGQALLPGVIIAELISILITAFICIFVTHTIAGPVYRMERVARSIGEGDLTNFIKLRPKDELKDLADSMNEMTMGLRNKVTSLKEASERVKSGLERLKSSGKITGNDEVFEAAGNIHKIVDMFVLEREIDDSHADRKEEKEEA